MDLTTSCAVINVWSAVSWQDSVKAVQTTWQRLGQGPSPVFVFYEMTASSDSSAQLEFQTLFLVCFAFDGQCSEEADRKQWERERGE